MTTIESLVRDYLDRLDVATADLPPDLREDLRSDVRAHLDEVAAGSSSEADVRAALDRLGAPEAIAAAGRETLPSVPAGPDAGRGTGRALDIAAVLLLLFGGFVLPGIGWVAGVVLLWISASWTTGEKLLGTLVWPGGLLAPLAVGLVGFSTATCVTESEIGPDGVETIISSTCPQAGTVQAVLPFLVMALVTIAPVVVASLLLRRAERRRTTAGTASRTSTATVVTIVVVLVVLGLLALALLSAGAVAWLRVS